MREDLMTIRELYIEHCVRQRLYDGTFQLDYIIFRH